MIFDIIKHAKQVLFDNSENGLNATNTQDAINELNNKLDNYEKITITPTDYIDQIVCIRKGDLVELRFGKTTKDTGYGASITIYTNLPKKFRPKESLNKIIPMSLYGITCYFGITTGGSISVRFTENIVSNTTLYGSIAYIGADY